MAADAAVSEAPPLTVLAADAPLRFPSRIAGLRAQIARSSEPGRDTSGNEIPPDPIDGLIVSYLDNAQYLTGFSGSNAVVIVTPERALFVTDGRYALQSRQQVPGLDRVILKPTNDMNEAVGELLGRLVLRRVGFEKAHLTVAAFDALRKQVPESVELVGTVNLVETVRRIKDADEIAAMRAAIAVADACFDYVCRTAKVGMTERELAWRMEVFMRHEHGAQALSFESIVGCGPNSALIHGRPSDRPLGASGEAEFLLLDFGAQLNGYCSDLTRTVVIGGAPTDRMQHLYGTVYESQKLALAAIRPGVAGKAVDTVARNFLTAQNLGDAFGHGLGHGLGRVVHDGPALSQRSEVILASGMVVTVEPGAYIEGFGGVRIEDDVLVTDAGCEILTQSAKELLVIG